MHSSLRVAWQKHLDNARQILADFDRNGHRELMNDLELGALDAVREFVESTREIAFAIRAEADRKEGN